MDRSWRRNIQANRSTLLPLHALTFTHVLLYGRNQFLGAEYGSTSYSINEEIACSSENVRVYFRVYRSLPRSLSWWIHICYFDCMWSKVGAEVTQLVLRLATGWTVRGSNPGKDEIFRTRLWGPPSLLYNGYRVSFTGVKRPGCRGNHPPPSSAGVKERVELYLYSPCEPSLPVLGLTLLF